MIDLCFLQTEGLCATNTACENLQGTLPPNSARATPQQQLLGMSGLVFISISSRPSAQVWSQTTSLAISVDGGFQLQTPCHNTDSLGHCL